nr:hypothetical protein [Tanacetum cinerariifolium]
MRLEKKRKARTLQPMKMRLFKGRVETFTNKSLVEDASKQGRNDDKTEDLNLTDEVDTEVLVEDKGSGEKGGSTADQDTTARLEVSTATPSTPLTKTTISDKGKGVLVEEEPEKLEKVKRRDQGLAQIESDAELAQSIYEEEFTELNRAQKERQKQEEANIAALTEEFDEIQARMDLKHKTFEELQKLYQKEQNWIDDFVPMDSKKEEKKSVEHGSKGKKGKRIKTVVDSALKQKSFKKQKMMQEQESTKSDEEESANYEREKEELRMWLTVVSDEEETVDPEILATKYPIVDWESHILGNVSTKDVHVYKIIRANGNTSYHKSLSSMLRKFDRQDLVDLHRLVMERFEDDTLEEKRYPLNKEMLEKMLNWKLKAEAENTMAFELLKFIKLQVQEWRDVWIHPPGDQDADNEET